MSSLASITPQDILKPYVDSVPANAATVDVTLYWSTVLMNAIADARDAGIDTGATLWTQAVQEALLPFGLAGMHDLVTGGVKTVAASETYLAETGLFRLGDGASSLVLDGSRQAAYAEGGDDSLTVISSNYNSFVLDGGAGNDTLVGSYGADWLDGGTGRDLMAGGAGHDAYVVDDAGDVVLEAAYAGTDTVRASLSHTLSENVEALVLTGADAISGTGNELANTLTGNAAANVLKGLDGDDTLDGGAGADTMQGGFGRDVYIVDSAGDQVIESGAGSYDVYDEVRASLDYTLGLRVENLVLTGSGNLRGTGNTLDNRLTGNSGNNVLDGGAGSDTLAGGAGNDTYYVDHGYDSVQEQAGGGVDTVYSTVSYSLSSSYEIENLRLSGTADINATGNQNANALTGNSGDNVLDGGAGADTLAGGAGDDVYHVDDARDVVQEDASQGIDRVHTGLSSYVLGSNVEELVLYAGYNDAIARDGTGNSLDNTIIGSNGQNIIRAGDGSDSLFGNAGIDTLYGDNGDDVLDGGDGADILNGGYGDDLYIVNDAGDRVIEAAGRGTDSVRASVSLTLAAEVETLELTGSYNLDGTGNVLANRILGNSGNNVLDGKAGADSLIGGAGQDTYVVDSANDQVIEYASGGTDLVLSAVSWTLGANLEALTLTGTDSLAGTGNDLGNTLTGNAGANVLKGLDGDDTLDGGAGADALYGGYGRDVYIVDSTGDTVFETGTGSSDTYDEVRASVNYTLGTRVENLTLAGTGNLRGTGNSLANRLTGNSGNNILDGKQGNDMMAGGAGNDTYYVDSTSDGVTEAVGTGIDTVYATVTYSVANQEIERLILSGSADINATGNQYANTLTGNTGDNILDGGAGIDTLSGDFGDDTYIVDDAADQVRELAGRGTDQVQTALGTYTLGDSVEDLTLYVRYIDSVARDGTGNSLDNTLTGTNGQNVLSGLDGNDTLIGNGGTDSLNGGAGADVLDGGTGDDVMTGGAGDDVYLLDSVGDRVVEAAAGGTDTVRAGFTIALGSDVENLVLTGSSIADGTGNSLANRLTGNSAANRLDGGTGADTLAGGSGNDTYVVDQAGDRVIEAVGAGTDTVLSAVTYTLGIGLENLTLTGAGRINGTGNEQDNILIGNSAANILTGGFGQDDMTGGAGADTFVWNHSAESKGSYYDIVTDFSAAGGDTLDFSGVDANLNAAGNQAFTYVGSSYFSAAGQMRAYVSGGDLYIAMNLDSNTSTVEMTVRLDDVTAFPVGSVML